MQKVLAYLAVSVALSGCGGSGSSGDTADTNDSVETTTNTGSTSGSSAGMENSDEETPVGENTTGSSTAGGGTAGGDSGADVTQYGLIEVTNEEFVEFSAGFFEFSTPVSFSTLLDQVRPASDSCTVTRIQGSTEIPDIDDIFGDSIVEPISAGEVLTISTPAGSYAELVKTELFGLFFYMLEEEDTLATPAPANLIIDIPGDQFTAFNNVTFPPLIDLEVSSPGVLEQITTGTSYSWEANTNPNSFIEIDAFARSADLSEFISLDCIVLDDGSFSFPADIQSQLGSTFSGFGSISRVAVNVSQSGSSILAVVSASDR